MSKRVSTVLAVCALACILVLGMAYGGSGKSDKKAKLAVEVPDESNRKFTPQPVDFSSLHLSDIGTPTTLTGFWDYQVNGGACQMIRVNPANGNIHVIMMVADDSTAQSTSRRTAYAFSTNSGSTWNNFSNVRVPTRRSGYPFLDLGQGAIAGAAIIANHSVIPPNTDLQSTSYIDSPEGGGAFAEINAPPFLEAGGADEPIWPPVAGASDGSVVMSPGRFTAGTTHMTRTSDFTVWSAWVNFPGADQGAAENVIVSNATGRVAVLEHANGLNLAESTNNGATWPTTAVIIHPPQRIVGPDTFGIGWGADGVYNRNNFLAALEVTNQGANEPTDQAQIFFWSAATGLRLAVPHDTSKFIRFTNHSQGRYSSTVGYPVIGTTGDSIVIVFSAFQRDTSAAGFNFSDLWYTASSNGGVTWTPARNLTSTPAVDERYPSISKWNQRGFANIVWQEKLDPGSTVQDGRPVTRASQKFLRFLVDFRTTDVREEGKIANSYKLSQNYPNPFNPSTKIVYAVPAKSDVKLTVYNMVGQKVATLVDGVREAGSYEADFFAPNLASGVYYYTLNAGSFTSTKKMVLMK